MTKQSQENVRMSAGILADIRTFGIIGCLTDVTERYKSKADGGFGNTGYADYERKRIIRCLQLF